MPARVDRNRAIGELIDSRPRIHEPEHDWGLDRPTLLWLAENVKPEWRTIETGCGQSSILFALAAATHTIVAPAAHEHEAVRSASCPGYRTTP